MSSFVFSRLYYAQLSGRTLVNITSRLRYVGFFLDRSFYMGLGVEGWDLGGMPKIMALKGGVGGGSKF